MQTHIFPVIYGTGLNMHHYHHWFLFRFLRQSRIVSQFYSYNVYTKYRQFWKQVSLKLCVQRIASLIKLEEAIKREWQIHLQKASKQMYFLPARSHPILLLITAKLVIESVSFGRVRIRGSATNFYLCVDKRGRLRARVSLLPFLGFKCKNRTFFFAQTSQWEYRLGNNWQDFWMSCLFRTFLEPELPYNGCSNYVIKSIFVLCFQNTVTMSAKTKESPLMEYVSLRSSLM